MGVISPGFEKSVPELCLHSNTVEVSGVHFFWAHSINKVHLKNSTVAFLFRNAVPVSVLLCVDMFNTQVALTGLAIRCDHVERDNNCRWKSFWDIECELLNVGKMTGAVALFDHGSTLIGEAHCCQCWCSLSVRVSSGRLYFMIGPNYTVWNGCNSPWVPFGSGFFFLKFNWCMSGLGRFSRVSISDQWYKIVNTTLVIDCNAGSVNAVKSH